MAMVNFYHINSEVQGSTKPAYKYSECVKSHATHSQFGQLTQEVFSNKRVWSGFGLQ